MVGASCTGAKVADPTGAGVALIGGAGVVVGTAEASGTIVAVAPQAIVNMTISADIHVVLRLGMLLFLSTHGPLLTIRSIA